MQYRHPMHHGCPVTFGRHAQYPLPPKQEKTVYPRQELDAFPQQEDERACQQPLDLRRDRVPGMVYHVPHDLRQLYDPQPTLQNGTLFHVLNKPMAHCKTYENRMPGTQDQALAFTAWEVRLYLDTHPRDEQALDLYRRLCQQMGDMQYACAFMACPQHTWEWIQDPWPWEYDCQQDWRD